jgi:hypothetical protein
MVQDEFAKVHVDLPNNPDTGGEAMWATPLGNDLYELRNSPFFAYGLNYGDVVRAVPRAPDQKPSVLEVVRRSGHRTAWVTFIDEASAQARSQRLAELHRWQASTRTPTASTSRSTLSQKAVSTTFWGNWQIGATKES